MENNKNNAFKIEAANFNELQKNINSLIETFLKIKDSNLDTYEQLISSFKTEKIIIPKYENEIENLKKSIDELQKNYLKSKDYFENAIKVLTAHLSNLEKKQSSKFLFLGKKEKSLSEEIEGIQNKRRIFSLND
ncbi:hypothetical protein ACOTVD_08985 [Campylobacter jejuni]|uniref:hypothetical protein n=1 Tax=Campylobacter jejuni TaxID=197 RepID=UPI0008759479|nr:hypothetical protein [Campylobacter jejuni]EEU7469624.1 hypothetical protein [Campylobacter jejuni]OEV61764.1 hypothetical protein AJY73_10435 [Campylobacter jejuni]HEG2941907.1 hypothetical protein [Campylobacter jejuni]